MHNHSLHADQVLKEHIDSLPAKRKKAHRRASRHALRLKSKRRSSVPPPSVPTTTDVTPLPGVSRGSVSSLKIARSFDMGTETESGR